MILKAIYRGTIHPKAPYHFDYSVENPSHYPTPTGKWEPDKLWFTLRWRREPYGFRMLNKGTINEPAIELTIHGAKKLAKKEIEALLDELAYRFEWYGDYSEFYKRFGKDKLLGPVINKFEGMRMFCREDLYGYLMIAILLQNANVKRTTQMTQAMLENYGDLLEFDGQCHYCFWSPERLVEVSEEELRALKVGYRAKSFLRVSQDFVAGKIDEIAMRRFGNEELRKSLLSIYGVGPASLDYLMRDVFHRRDALNTVPPWETKIYSRLLFDKENEDVERILEEIKNRFGEWRAVAIHYLFMDLSWRQRERPIEWFKKLMPF